MSYIQSAHARLRHFVEAGAPTEISHFPTPDEVRERKAYVKELARAFGDYLHALARDTQSNTAVSFDLAECLSAIPDAVEDTDFYCSLEDAAERLIEDAIEDALEPAG